MAKTIFCEGITFNLEKRKYFHNKLPCNSSVLYLWNFLASCFFEYNAMNTQQAQILIDKINALWRSMNATPGQISSIERDLMRSYIRDLYEAFSLEAQAPTTTNISTNPPPPIKDPRVEKPVENTPPPVIETKSVDEPLPPTVIPPPPPKPMETPVSVPGVGVKSNPSDKRFDSLFKAPTSEDLSDKLSRQPITELNKAFTINDRILYINDLFGKDHNVFSEIILALDRFQDLTQAKMVLTELADQYHWLDEARVETAQSFVQLVQRRYLK